MTLAMHIYVLVTFVSNQIVELFVQIQVLCLLFLNNKSSQRQSVQVKFVLFISSRYETIWLISSSGYSICYSLHWIRKRKTMINNLPKNDVRTERTKPNRWNVFALKTNYRSFWVVSLIFRFFCCLVHQFSTLYA